MPDEAVNLEGDSKSPLQGIANLRLDKAGQVEEGDDEIGMLIYDCV